ncbi:MAG TPA: PASTA domain-containing protein [Streptosporangiaceae bacterium]|jgi:hypothetical protein
MAGLEGDVTIPVAGKVPKKELAIGGAIVGVLVGVYYWRHRQAASTTTAAAAAATSTDQYPPDGTTGNPDDPYSTDPATGQTYGDEATGSGGTYGAYDDTGALDEEGDDYPADGTIGNPSDPYSTDPSSGITYGDEGYVGGTSSDTGTDGPPFSTNAQWTTYVLSQEQSLGSSTSTDTLQAALGLYLDGQPVSAADQTLIFGAIAIAGDPPVPGANGYPPAVQVTGSQGPGSGGGSGSVIVPEVTGQRRETAFAELRQAGLEYTTTGVTAKAGGAYYVTAQSPAAGAQAKAGASVTLTIAAGTGPPAAKPPANSNGLYWHADLNYFTINGVKSDQPSGTYKIGGKSHYWHADPSGKTKPYMSPAAPSGPATAG